MACSTFRETLILAAMSHPGNACPNVHDWGQVCLFQGKNGRDFRAFTSYPIDCAPLIRILGLKVAILTEKYDIP
jgi:hypothetical protein